MSLRTDHSAKIKRIFVELSNYRFFHGPSEIGRVDRRFIGRKAIAGKVRDLLTRYETKSGSYLITGYRGAGKSSLVAKVLSELSSVGPSEYRMSSYVRIFFPLVFLSLIDVGQSTVTRILFAFVPGTILAVSILLLAWNHLKNIQLAPHYGRARSTSIWKRLGTLSMEVDDSPESRLRTLARDYIVLSALQISALVVFEIAPRSDSTPLDGSRSFQFKLGVYLFLFLSLAAVSMLWSVYKRERRAVSFVNNVKATFSALASWFANYINYSHRVHVHVNLGQDSIDETDMLRLIAKSIQSKYAHFVRHSPSDLPWRFVKFSVLYLVVGMIYYNPQIYSLNQSLVASLNLHYILPSQGAFMLTDDSKIGDFRQFRGLQWRSIGPDNTAEEGKTRRRGIASFRDQFDRVILEDHQEYSDHIFDKRPHYFGSVGKVLYDVANHLDLFIQATWRKATSAIPGVDKLRDSAIQSADGGEGRTSWNQVRTFLGTSSGLKEDVPKNPNRRSQPDILEGASGGAEEGVEKKENHYVSSDFLIIPNHVDYLLFLYLVLAWLIVSTLSRNGIFGIVTHRQIIKQLRELNDAIDSQITSSRDVQLSGAGGLPFFSKLSWNRTFRIETPREIEKHLLEILERIDRIPKLTVRPSFIFIFDELDKIEPHKNLTLGEELDATSLGAENGSVLTSFTAARERQHRILSLLSNLKHFLTTAKAKFIFIAGREMYDASLADVSDRHFFMGSIFNEVIYVPSFLRDPTDHNLSDVTSMTESYICQFLVPDDHPCLEKNLISFNDYLLKNQFSEERDPRTSDRRKLVLRRAREKVVYDLQSFITYLTYRSNGAPKKITRFLECNVRSIGKEELEDPHNLCVGASGRSLYLELGYYDQYASRLVAYLATPVFFSINRGIKDFGDKLLVSTSFLLDHIYKFHGFGFSKRHLELLPEIIDINKAPELRELVGRILGFLSGTHVEEIINGMYSFKFRKRITEEIAFLSKVSERESAAFNFTLDESISIKRHYRRRLEELAAQYPSRKESREPGDYVHSIGFVRMILGDLHFYDEEYDQAIVEYLEAVQSIQNAHPEEVQENRLVLLIRNLLKLGLAFERKKTYESALMTYSKLVATISSFATSPATAWGIREPGLQELTLRDVRLITQPSLAKLALLEKASLSGITEGHVLDACRELRRVSDQLGEISLAVRNNKDSEIPPMVRAEFFNKIGDILFFKNDPAFSADLVARAESEALDLPNKCTSRGSTDSLLASLSLGSRSLRTDSKVEIESTSVPAYLSFYLKGLSILGHELLGLELGRSASVGEFLLFFFNERKGYSSSATHTLPSSLRLRYRALREIGNTLSDVGDALLSCTQGNKESSVRASWITREFLRAAIRFLKKPDPHAREREGDISQLISTSGTWLEKAILHYIVSHLYYRQAGEHKLSAFQLSKILYVLRDFCAAENPRWFDEEMLEGVRHTISRRAIKAMYRMYDSASRLEIEKYKKILETVDNPRLGNELVSLQDISLSQEVVEIIILTKELELRVSRNPKPLYRSMFASGFSTVNSMYNRIHELRLKSRMNYMTFKRLGLEEALRSRGLADVKACVDGQREWVRECFGRDPKPLDLVVFLITDSIFCCHEISRSLRIYDISYMAGHLQLAVAHERLAWWCEMYMALVHTFEKEDVNEFRFWKNEMESEVERLIGVSEAQSISIRYHAELAVRHYYSAIETHYQGRAYRELLDKMHYLNDDFNDRLTHFCAANERSYLAYACKDGDDKLRVDERIVGLRRTIRDSTIYRVENYVQEVEHG